MSDLYYGKKIKSLGSLRYSFFGKKQTTPALKKLPSTDNSAKEQAKRARLQVLVRKAADQAKAPNVDVNSYGWKLSDNSVVPNYGAKEFAPHDRSPENHSMWLSIKAPLLNRVMHMQSCKSQLHFVL